jgi:hypothetical protein
MELINQKKAEDKFQELKDQFIEMAQLKSNFDIEKFTVKSRGGFLAHEFHFLMRQYSLALHELRRLYLDIEEASRRIEEYRDIIKKGQAKIEINTEHGKQDKYVDIEIERQKNQIDLQSLSLKNKLEMCKGFEKCRLHLIEKNGGNPPTNKQYQEEEPEYWKWFLKRAARGQARQRATGIQEGVWLNIEHLEQPALITEEFQVPVLDDSGQMNMTQANMEIEAKKDLLTRAENIKRISNG